MTETIIQFIPAGVVAVMAFLVRNAFNDFKQTIIGMGNELKTLAGIVNTQHTDVALLQQRISRLEADVKQLQGS